MTDLYARIIKAIRDEAIETLNAELGNSIDELTGAYERGETLYKPSDMWHRDSIIDDMVINTMNSMDTGDKETPPYNDDQRIFFRFIEGTLREMADDLVTELL